MATTKLKAWHGGIIYLAAALIITFPTIFKLHTVLYGYATDAPYYLWLTWWRQYSWQHGLSYTFQPLMQAPFGASQVVPGFSGLMIPMTLLAMLVGEVAAYNLMIIAAYTLSGWLAFLVVRRFMANQVIALIGGFLFMYSPYAVANTLHHVDLAHQWVIPLFALTLIAHHQKATIKTAIGVGAAFALANYMNPYYGYHVVIMAVTFGIVESIWVARHEGWAAVWARRRIALYAVSVIIGIVLFAPELIVIARTTYGANDTLHPFNQLAQPVEWFFFGSSRPWDFFLPSVNHPVLGRASKAAFDAIGSVNRIDYRLPMFREKGIDVDSRWFWLSHHSAQETMYLGFANLVMAIYGFVQWRKRGDGLWLAFFVTLGIIATMFTLPPFLPIGGVLRNIWEPLFNVAIPMPSLFTMRFLAPLRGVIRIMPVIVLCLAVLACYGLEAATSRLRKPSFRYATVIVFILFASFEYLRFPVVTPFNPPAYTVWLADQPADTVVALYPYSSGDGMYQYVHERALVNSISRPGTPPDMIVLIEQSTISEMRDGMPARLAALGTNYVIMPDGIPPVNGLQEIERFGDHVIYDIIADPVPLAVLYATNGEMWISESGWDWNTTNEKTLYIWNSFSKATTISLTFEGNFADSILIKRDHTPLLDEMNLYGIRMSNPLEVFEYPINELAEVNIDEAGHTDSIELTIGETILYLRWPDNRQHEIDNIGINIVK